MRGNLLLLVGSCGLVLVTSGGCVDDFRRNPPATPNGGKGGGGAAGAAGSEASGGSDARGGSSGGKAGAPGAGTAGGGVGGQVPLGGGAGTGGDAGNEAGGEAGAAVGAGAGGESGDAAGGEAGANGGQAGETGVGGTAGSSGSSGSGGTTGGGGSGGSGGEIEEPFDGPCPGSLFGGWASIAGHDFDPGTAPGIVTEVIVTDADSLKTYAKSLDPYVIRISGTIAVPVLDVSSNKIIVGHDSAATLEGGIRIAGASTAPIDMVSNVAIRNLRINAATADTSQAADEDDGIMVAYAHHVWIDHVDVWDAPGDNLDVINGSDYVTVSWSKFRHVNGIRRTGARIGQSDANSAEDAGRLKVTFHHNWWTDSVDQRMPRVRFGDVHVFNNYYSNRLAEWRDNAYCIAAGISSRLVIENNFFDESLNPHVFFSFVDGAASFTEPTAQIVANGNFYLGASDAEGGKLSGQGAAFTPPYPVTLEPADGVLRNTSATAPVSWTSRSRAVKAARVVRAASEAS